MHDPHGNVAQAIQIAQLCIKIPIFYARLSFGSAPMSTLVRPLQGLDPARFETPALLKQLVASHRNLAELKGVAMSMPNQGILINTLVLQEAKDSSEIENIVTTHDELFREVAHFGAGGGQAAKEVSRYAQALRVGFDAVRQSGLLTLGHILQIQEALERNQAGLRKVPGTALLDGAGQVVYTPPSPEHLPALMGDLERFINDGAMYPSDPLIKMALIHHQFETIHPFYDGNGRTGRIINVLYLVRQALLDIPVLYLSRAIVRNKGDYYRLLQSVRDDDRWEEWVLYMLRAVEQTAVETIETVKEIRALVMDYKHRIRDEYRFYSQDLINNLFSHPYTRIEFIQRELGVSRLTAASYLDHLVAGGFLRKHKVGRSNYYINEPLLRVLTCSRQANAS